MNKVLVIDDIRVFHYATKHARDYWDGIKALESERWDLLLLDHDLASIDPNGREYTGYDILCYLEQNPQYLPSRIDLVTANPVGRQRMQALIQRLYDGQVQQG